MYCNFFKKKIMKIAFFQRLIWVDPLIEPVLDEIHTKK